MSTSTTKRNLIKGFTTLSCYQLGSQVDLGSSASSSKRAVASPPAVNHQQQCPTSLPFSVSPSKPGPGGPGGPGILLKSYQTHSNPWFLSCKVDMSIFGTQKSEDQDQVWRQGLTTQFRQAERPASRPLPKHDTCWHCPARCQISKTRMPCKSISGAIHLHFSGRVLKGGVLKPCTCLKISKEHHDLHTLQRAPANQNLAGPRYLVWVPTIIDTKNKVSRCFTSVWAPRLRVGRPIRSGASSASKVEKIVAAFFHPWSARSQVLRVWWRYAH